MCLFEKALCLVFLLAPVAYVYSWTLKGHRIIILYTKYIHNFFLVCGGVCILFWQDQFTDSFVDWWLTLTLFTLQKSLVLNKFNPMRTTCWLVKRNSLSYFELIRRGVRNNSLMCKFVSATFLKPYHNWLHKWTFQDMDQSEMVLEGQ